MEQNVSKAKIAAEIPPQVREVSEVYLMALDCPRSLTALILIRHREWAQVARLRANPTDYATPQDFHLAASASDWLRKYPGLPLGINLEVATGQSWIRSERECRTSNRYLKIVHRCDPKGHLEMLLSVAAGFVADLMGPLPMNLAFRFGPGATVSDPSRATTALDKVSSRLTCTPESQALLPLWEGTAWERSHLESTGYKKKTYTPLVVPGNIYFTVPKSATILRACAKGPSFNVSGQLAVGREMRSRILRFLAYDLSAGQARHQALALLGSVTGAFATLDSERASDTNAFELVKRLFSHNLASRLWFELLCTLREPATKIKGTWVGLAKFSAMGNGYTFELETIVFLALCYAIAWAQGLDADLLVRTGEISVYGDDVIVPTGMAHDVAWLFSQAGFTLNRDKSFVTGPFRESCGGDFFEGHNVSTVKLDVDPSSPADWFSVHNRLKERFCDRYPDRADAARRLLNVVKDQVPRKYRSMYGPKWLGDVVLHGWYGPQIRTTARKIETIGKYLQGPPDPNAKAITDPNQWVGTLEVLKPKIRYADLEAYAPEAQLAYILYSHSCRAPARRPTGKVEYSVTHFEGDYHLLFEDNVPERAPGWLAKSSYARFFGISPEGKFVS